MRRVCLKQFLSCSLGGAKSGAPHALDAAAIDSTSLMAFCRFIFTINRQSLIFNELPSCDPNKPSANNEYETRRIKPPLRAAAKKNEKGSEASIE